MRAIILAAVAALALASSASAAVDAFSPAHGSGGGTGKVAAGPYKLDATGKCHAANGQFAKLALCHTTPPPRHPCHDPKTGRFIKCA